MANPEAYAAAATYVEGTHVSLHSDSRGTISETFIADVQTKVGLQPNKTRIASAVARFSMMMLDHQDFLDGHQVGIRVERGSGEAK